MKARSDYLERYRQKRDFTKTPEPKAITAAKAGHRYLIQKHAATRLHYDFRLELDGVLKSWAVTRGPSLDPQVKRLAVEVEDHPVAYGSFEGIIPKGQYGGGTVMLWDEGSWEPIGDPYKGLASGKLEFRLHGKRLEGEWTLVRMRTGKKDKGRNNWLLIKRNDDIARPNDADRFLAKNVTSVASGRTMEKISSAADQVWQSKGAKASIQKKSDVPTTAKQILSRLPGFIKPQLATLSDAMPQGGDWVHEIKFDGYRALAYIQNGNTRILTRTGQDWTHKFQLLAQELAKFSAKNAILDGEIVATDAKGISSFKLLQEGLSEENSDRLQYYVFDLLYSNGKSLLKAPLRARKQRLESLLKKKKLRSVFYSEHFTGKNKDFLERVCDLRLEGIVSKRIDAPYSSGRGLSWLKSKCHKRQEFVIGGFTLPTHKERGVGALLLGYYDGDKMFYAGKVGTGFDHEISSLLREKLDKLNGKQSPFVSVPADGRRGAKWVKPVLVCEVEFTEWTGDGRLRHPSFQSLREDKPARKVYRDIPIAQEKEKEFSMSKSAPAGKGTLINGVNITHPDRVIYPGTNITKLELAQYYLTVADHLLPYIVSRPLSMIRCPEGAGEPCFFQRHIARGQSPDLLDANVNVKGRHETYLMIKDVKGLITLIQWGVIELHPWGCLADNPDLPDRIIFDLDPAPEIPWKSMIEAAREIRDRMLEFGLESFLKTTGGKGLHVTVPIARHYGWPTIKAFAKAIAQSMEHDKPQRYIANSSKAARKNKIFIDYLRNDLTSTAVAPFSARARKGAPVATTLAWSELNASLKPAAFTIETVPKRLKKLKEDPWADFLKLRQKISSAHLRALKIIPE